ncbi:MAG TPA: bifunctional methylenetetrahydrofolate dehydrogenase/methenyltetrahydrofolate cyclohydrolase FolD [Gammaproteobacteria bacterium]|nr:bifunctional methylenetetrahydrofolate dehydrogenase/methenyltetrahydrofolate cyclohydrolase FolD [Gammaproteobacteria bacterium]
MTAQLIDGKSFAATLRAEVAADIQTQIQQGKRQPALAVILAGLDPASMIYVNNKRQACEEVGIQSHFHHLPADVSEETLFALIQQLNQDPAVDGILLQVPLPDQFNDKKMLEWIDPKKDVDGFHPYNLGRLAQGRPLFRSCTPFGIMTLLNTLPHDYRNQHAVIIGASYIVGRPMALELLLAGCTVTICQRSTRDLAEQVRQADIVISAVGIPNLIKGNWIKKGAIVIDVGTTRLPDGKLAGDIEFDEASRRAAFITPVPGGVGPMTVAMLLKNTLTAFSLSLS